MFAERKDRQTTSWNFMGKVYCSVYNGIGNQLFGYALGMFLSKEFKKELHIDLTKLNTINRLAKAGLKKDTPRKYELVRLGFNDPVRQFHPVEFLRKSSIFAPKSYTVIDSRKDRLISKVNGSPNIYSIGWGDLSVVKKVLPEMKKKFSPDFELSAENREVLNLIQNTNAVALHVRRTDYLNFKTGARFSGICTETYYRNAIKYINSVLTDPYFVVFSDDIDFVKKEITLPNSYFVQGNPGYVDLYLMSRCRHFILANSTFSYWAALLSVNDEKIVCVPEFWYNRPLEKEDYIPEEWQRIKIA